MNASISLDFDANRPQWQGPRPSGRYPGRRLQPDDGVDDFEDGVYRLAATPRPRVYDRGALGDHAERPIEYDGGGASLGAGAGREWHSGGGHDDRLVTSGGGTVLPAMPVVTDASGIATVESWTLGATQGQTPSARTATGSDIAGNPELSGQPPASRSLNRG